MAHNTLLTQTTPLPWSIIQQLRHAKQSPPKFATSNAVAASYLHKLRPGELGPPPTVSALIPTADTPSRRQHHLQQQSVPPELTKAQSGQALPRVGLAVRRPTAASGDGRARAAGPAGASGCLAPRAPGPRLLGCRRRRRCSSLTLGSGDSEVTGFVLCLLVQFVARAVFVFGTVVCLDEESRSEKGWRLLLRDEINTFRLCMHSTRFIAPAFSLRENSFAVYSVQ